MYLHVMKVHLIRKKSIYLYLNRNSNSKAGFENWLRVINASNWKEPNEIFHSFANADILGKGTNRVVFNIGGNKYRCICMYSFGTKFVHLFIKWIGTHAEYTKICNSNQQFNIDNF